MHSRARLTSTRAAPGRAGGDGVITATELYLYLRGRVEDEAEGEGHHQTPGLWPLKKHDKGNTFAWSPAVS